VWEFRIISELLQLDDVLPQSSGLAHVKLSLVGVIEKDSG
jgi:hypothetical protein